MKEILCLFLLFALSSCETYIISKDTEIEVLEGEEFVLEFSGVPSTGYLWILENPLEGTDYVEATNLDENNSADFVATGGNPADGASGLFKFIFNALKAGEESVDLKFAYLRTWEDKPPEKEFIVKITILRQ